MKSYNDKAREAIEARQAAIHELRALDSDIAAEGPTEEQRAQISRINTAIDVHDEAAERWLKEASMEERSVELEKLVGSQSDNGIVDARSGRTQIEEEVRQLVLPADHPEARGNATFTASSEEIANLARRDLLAGTATDGAELVPTSLFGQLYVSLREGATSMFSLGRSVVTQSGEQMDFPAVSSFSTAALISEAGTISESDPQFSTVSMDAYKYGLAIQISSELEADNAVGNAMSWVIEQAADGIRRGVGAALITADGSSKPNGVDNGSTTSVLGGVIAPTADELVTIQHDIASPYRQGASWVFNDATMLAIRLLKDGDSRYLWEPSLTAGGASTLLGAPTYTDSNLAGVGANAKIGLYGNLNKGYMVRTVANLRADRSTDYAFLNDVATWRFLGRFDGEIMDNAAYSVITCAAS